MTPEENERLTKVGPGTPCGELLRRYWMPLCPATEMPRGAKKRLKVLGEALILFQDGAGRFGLVPEHCPHRNMSLYFGFVEEDGIRCAYHGWKFAADGVCIEQPFEARKSALRDKSCIRSYPVQQLAGILFGYLGPMPVPQLPRWDTMVRKDGLRRIAVLPEHHCNWLQAQENTVDPTHTYYLHGHMMVKKLGLEEGLRQAAYTYRPIKDIDFELCKEANWAGIRKIRVYGGDKGERETGHPSLFPNALLVPQGKDIVIHFKTPIDDEHMYALWLEFTPNEDGSIVEQADADIPVSYVPSPRDADGEYELTSFIAQDMMAWETQGPVFDRNKSLLSTSDRGVVMFRRLLNEQIEVVRRGGTPAGVFYDPALNDIIRFQVHDGQARMAREMDTASS